MLALGTILHATDFSKSAEHAFQLACALARDYNAQLIVLHVARRPIVTPVMGVVPPEPVEYEETLKATLHQLQLDNPTLRLETQLLFVGDTVSEILRTARETGADLIVMGTHGRTGLGRLLLGSVAEGVLRHAPCPVVTVRAPQPQSSGSLTPKTADQASQPVGV